MGVSECRVYQHVGARKLLGWKAWVTGLDRLHH
jgi:hypothetical protein